MRQSATCRLAACASICSAPRCPASFRCGLGASAPGLFAGVFSASECHVVERKRLGDLRVAWHGARHFHPTLGKIGVNSGARGVVLVGGGLCQPVGIEPTCGDPCSAIRGLPPGRIGAGSSLDTALQICVRGSNPVDRIATGGSGCGGSVGELLVVGFHHRPVPPILRVVSVWRVTPHRPC